ncbi:MAG: alkaline phosphatase D family protein, partial [Gemmatimonadaceae bacterium]
SYRSEEPLDRVEAKPFVNGDFPEFLPEEAIEILDAGRAYNHGDPPEEIAYGKVAVPNFRRDSPPQTILGEEQKQWFFDRLRKSNATWKIWGNTTATLEMRADLQNLPTGLTKPWPGAAYAGCASCDHSTALTERGEIYDFVQQHGITGFATIAGDRHSFWAGLAAKSLPPKQFAPVGIAFVVGSISAPGMVEALEHVLPKEHPLRPLYLGQAVGDSRPQPTLNLLLRHGVQSCLEYEKSGDIQKARAASNPELSPHLSFVDMGGHGYAIVSANSTDFESEFVCIPRPLERSSHADGGAILYRARFRSPLWAAGQAPKINAEITEGNPRFSIG